MSDYEYRVYERQYGKRTWRQLDVTTELEAAINARRQAEYIPKSGSWHIERRPVDGWEDFDWREER